MGLPCETLTFTGTTRNLGTHDLSQDREDSHVPNPLIKKARKYSNSYFCSQNLFLRFQILMSGN